MRKTRKNKKKGKKNIIIITAKLHYGNATTSVFHAGHSSRQTFQFTIPRQSAFAGLKSALGLSRSNSCLLHHEISPTVRAPRQPISAKPGGGFLPRMETKKRVSYLCYPTAWFLSRRRILSRKQQQVIACPHRCPNDLPTSIITLIKRLAQVVVPRH